MYRCRQISSAGCKHGYLTVIAFTLGACMGGSKALREAHAPMAASNVHTGIVAHVRSNRRSEAQSDKRADGSEHTAAAGQRCGVGWRAAQVQFARSRPHALPTGSRAHTRSAMRCVAHSSMV